ncbi:MAG: hypothetical protein ABIM89_16865, partial [Mycobacteriales bacterium]
MTGNEDKLRRVLFEEANGVLPAADAWPRLRAGVDRRRKWRQLLQYGGATAGATAAIVAGVLLTSGEGSSPIDDPATTATNDAASSPDAVTETDTPPPTGSASDIAVTSTALPTGTPTADKFQPPPIRSINAGRLGPNFAAIVHIDGGTRVALISKQDGSTVRFLTEDRGLGDVTDVAASPDGAYVYYIGHGGQCAAGVYRVPSAGGGSEVVIHPTSVVMAFALNGDGTRIAALRAGGCRGGVTDVLDEYDASSGKRLRQIADIPHPTYVPALAWHPERNEIAFVRSVTDAGNYQVDVLDLSAATAEKTESHELPPCFGGFGQLALTGDALFSAQSCGNAEEIRGGRIVRVDRVTRKVEIVTSTPVDESVAGLYVEPGGNTLVYSAVRWGEEDLSGPTKLYWLVKTAQRVDNGVTALDGFVTGLAW